jgi:ATP-dependent helicase/nuclease subunit A
MRTPDSIPSEVRRKQTEASDPDVSAWVAANAGSGKTHVLARRVINLLLKGVEPEKILCITFTKAAAANMAKQVFDRLANWTTLDDAALDKAIRAHANMAADARRRALARQLFARALETPGGLKVQTIHAFCTQLLHQFPFEANVAARFTVLDEAEQSQLIERLTLNVLLFGASHPGSALAAALDSAMIAGADQTFRDVVREAIGQRDAVNKWVESAGGVEAAIAKLSKTLEVEPSDTIDAIETELFAGPIPPSDWPDLAKAFARGGKMDCEQADRFVRLATLTGLERVETYLDIFCTSPSSGRTPRKSIVSKAIGGAALAEQLTIEQQRVWALLERRRAVACRDRSAALLTVTHEVLTRYHKEKQRRGLLDYDDLIDNALGLLSSVDAGWVHYKLDLGIDHVLVDEAQDTSHKQWEIVRRLTAEFTAGAGARSIRRTMFAVGDAKQSIYSFQDAAPKEFAAMQRHFKSAYEKSGQKFVVCKFEHSFRSGEAILRAVDEVFKRADITLSVTAAEDGFPPHIALPDAPPSVVEIWEPMKPDERKEIEGWDAPFDSVSETSPRVKLARRIARSVRKMVDEGAASYRDVLILVRQRGELFEAIIRALKNQNVEVAGADRLMLAEHIAVMDLMVLADALLLPEDDLALATVLRSPLFGFEDQDLYDIAWDRGRASLRAALTRKAGENQIFADTAARLDALAQAARRETPFAFYALLLGEGGARRRFLARLGPEANDALDEFLNLALEYERRETPSLQGFLTWLRDARAGEARHGDCARRSARHDRARRQGPRSVDRDPRRHHDAARGSAAAAAVATCRRRHDLGRTQGRRRAESRRGAHRRQHRGRARIPAAPLRRHDAPRRPADRGRRRRYQGAAERLLVRPCARCARSIACRRRRERGKGSDLSQATSRQRQGARSIGGGARENRAARNPAVVAAAGSARNTSPDANLAVLGLRRGDRPRHADGGLCRRSPKGAHARTHRASPDAVVARRSAGWPRGRHRAIS